MKPGYFPANILFVFLFAVALFYFLQAVSRLYRYMKLGQPENRFDQKGARWSGVLTYVLGQRRVVGELSGWGHFFIFWGFIVITIATIETFGIGIHHGFAYWKIFGKGVAGFLYQLQDLFCAAVVIALLVSVFRRYFLKPIRLKSDHQLSANLDAGLIVTLILALVILLFGERAIEHLLAQRDASRYFPDKAYISVAAAGLFEGFSVDALYIWYSFFWWAHTLVILFFLAYIPRSKHLHLLGAAPNIFFRDFRPFGELTKMNLEDETAETYGVSKVEEFTWKQLLDLYACTECGRCAENCPAYLTGKPLNPKYTILHLKEHLEKKGKLKLARRGTGEEAAEAQGELAKALIGDVCLHDEIWSCTACGNCMQHCPVYIEHIDKYVDMRRYLVLMESNFPTEAGTAFRNWETNSNPWGLGSASRGDWAETLPVKTLAEDQQVEYLFYVGCAGSFSERSKKISIALAKLLDTAGVSYGILGAEEKCCGETARRMGNEYLFQTIAAELVEVINGYGVKKIITACPHGYNCLKNEYPQFGGNWEVYHHSEFLAMLLRQGKFKPSKGMDKKLAFHDSCYLGRFNELYDDPRDVLKALPELRLAEMARNHDKSFCCGAGGGRMWMEETLGEKKINDERTDQALRLKPDIIGVSCPFCTTMFEDGLKARDMEEKVQVLDIAELLAQSILT